MDVSAYLFDEGKCVREDQYRTQNRQNVMLAALARGKYDWVNSFGSGMQRYSAEV